MPPIDPFFLTPQDMDGPEGRTCSGCGYDLRGIPMSQPCPECGLVAAPSGPIASPREASESAFDSGITCGQCGTPTPGLPIGALCPECARKLPDSHSGPVASADGDNARPCVSCGYDLQGSPPMGPCPECGFVPTRAGGGGVRTAARPNILAAGERSLRVSDRFARGFVFRLGLFMLLAGLVTLAGVDIASMMGMASKNYLRALMAVGAVIAAASWFVTPRSLDIEQPVFFVVRWGARVTLPCWVLGLWIELEQGTYSSWTSQTFYTVALLELVGIFGVALLLASLASIANELEIKHTARRLTTTIWLIGPVGVLTWLMPFPEKAVNIDPGPFGMVASIFILIVVGPWFWLLLRTIRSVLELLSLGRWISRAHHDVEERDRALRERVQRG